MNEETKQLQDAIQHGHEPDYVDARRLTMSIAGVVLLMVCGLLIVYAVQTFFAQRSAVSEPALSAIDRAPLAARAPAVTADQPQQLEALRQSEQRRLESYQWIDESQGLARIPIDRAMEILAKQGLPQTQPTGEEDGDASR